MLEARFALFCDYAFITIDQKLSIIGEFDRLISTSGTPTLKRGFVVASFEGPKNTEFEITAVFENKDGQKILPDKKLKINTGDGGRANILTQLVDVVFKDEGEHFVRFLDESGRELCNSRLVVVTPSDKVQD